jgi:hypothetical protein
MQSRPRGQTSHFAKASKSIGNRPRLASTLRLARGASADSSTPLRWSPCSATQLGSTRLSERRAPGRVSPESARMAPPRVTASRLPCSWRTCHRSLEREPLFDRPAAWTSASKKREPVVYEKRSNRPAVRSFNPGWVCCCCGAYGRRLASSGHPWKHGPCRSRKGNRREE